jgi:predicted DNA binding CopG/RHH family protein
MKKQVNIIFDSEFLEAVKTEAKKQGLALATYIKFILKKEIDSRKENK